MSVEPVREAIITHLLGLLNRECSKLCRYSTPSLFCKIPVEKMAEFKWDNLISELQSMHHCCLRFCTAWKQVQDGSCSLSWHLHSSSSAPEGEEL